MPFSIVSVIVNTGLAPVKRNSYTIFGSLLRFPKKVNVLIKSDKCSPEF